MAAFITVREALPRSSWGAAIAHVVPSAHQFIWQWCCPFLEVVVTWGGCGVAVSTCMRRSWGTFRLTEERCWEPGPCWARFRGRCDGGRADLGLLGPPCQGWCRSRHVRPACSPALPRVVAGPVPEGPSARQRSSANGAVMAPEQSSDGRAPGAGPVGQGSGAGLVWWPLEWVERRET